MSHPTGCTITDSLQELNETMKSLKVVMEKIESNTRKVTV